MTLYFHKNANDIIYFQYKEVWYNVWNPKSHVHASYGLNLDTGLLNSEETDLVPLCPKYIKLHYSSMIDTLLKYLEDIW